MFELIKGELFFVEYDKGSELVQEKFCNLEGHRREQKDFHGKNYTIHKGICLRCGEGTRYWKCTEKETKAFKIETGLLR